VRPSNPELVAVVDLYACTHTARPHPTAHAWAAKGVLGRTDKDPEAQFDELQQPPVSQGVWSRLVCRLPADHSGALHVGVIGHGQSAAAVAAASTGKPHVYYILLLLLLLFQDSTAALCDSCWEL
jgi:hypothetical protein